MQLFPFENGQIYQNGGSHTTATVPSVGVHVHTGIRCSCSVFNTPFSSLLHSVLLQLCPPVVPWGPRSGASSGHWEELGHSKMGTDSGDQEVSPSGFLLRLLSFWVLVFFEWRSYIWNLLEELLQICALSNKQPWLQYLTGGESWDKMYLFAKEMQAPMVCLWGKSIFIVFYDCWIASTDG